MTANRVFDQSIALQFRVVHDPSGLWSGTIDARLTADGLELTNTTTGEAVNIPYETYVRHEGGPFLLVPGAEGDLRLALTTSGVDQVRMASDLAEFVQSNHTTFDTRAYRLPRFLIALALLPLVMPVAMFAIYFLATMPHDDIGTLICCAAPGLLLAALMLRAARAGTPSVRARVRLCVALTFVVGGVQGAYFAWNYIDFYTWLPGRGTLAESQWIEFVPEDRRFRVDFPGEATRREERVPNTNKVTTIHGVDLKHSGYFVFVVELSTEELGQATPGRRFSAARDGFLKKNPNAKIASEQDKEIDGYPGREFSIANPEKGNFVVRLFLAGRRFYTLVAGGWRFTSETPNVKRFFRSFELLPPILPSPANLNGLFGYWAFDEEDGKLALDGSGADRHAEVHGTLRVPGIRGKALQLDGKSHVTLPESEHVDLPPHMPRPSYSIAGWMKTANGSSGTIISLRAPMDPVERIEVLVHGKKLQMKVTRKETDQTKVALPLITTVANAISPRPVDDNRWHHFVLLNNANWMNFYVDGIFVDRFPGTRAVAKRDREMGVGFEGILDEICVFDRVLDENEIRLLAGQ